LVPKLRVMPAGDPGALRLTGDEKLPVDVTLVVVEEEPPWVIVSVGGETETLKSGDGPAELTINVMATECVTAPPIAVIVRGYVPVGVSPVVKMATVVAKLGELVIGVFGVAPAGKPPARASVTG
jgi:hypothetical protein